MEYFFCEFREFHTHTHTHCSSGKKTKLEEISTQTSMVATPGSSAPFVASDETDYSTSEDDDEEGVTQRGVAQKGVVQRGVAVPTKNDTSDSEVSEQNLLELVKWSPFKRVNTEML